MCPGKLVFSQVMDHILWHTFSDAFDAAMATGRSRPSSNEIKFAVLPLPAHLLREPAGCRDLAAGGRVEARSSGINGRNQRNTLPKANQTRDLQS